MTLEQQGAYINLLANMWDDEHCSLPSDDSVLAVLSEANDRWNEIGTVVKQAFNEHPQLVQRLTNFRLLSEHEKQKAQAEQRREAGKKSGESRAKKRNARSTPVEQAFNGASNSNSSSNSNSFNKKGEVEISHLDQLALPRNLRTPEAAEAWENFIKYRSEIGKPLSGSSLDALGLWLKKHKWTSDRFCSAVLSTMAKGYVGLVEDDKRTGGKLSQAEEIQQLITELEAEEGNVI